MQLHARAEGPPHGRERSMEKSKALAVMQMNNVELIDMREHWQTGGSQLSFPNRGDIVIIKDMQKNHNQWKLAIVTDLTKGKDGTTKGGTLRSRKDNIEHTIQHFCPLELLCNVQQTVPLDPKKQRDTTATANLHIQEVVEDEESEL